MRNAVKLVALSFLACANGSVGDATANDPVIGRGQDKPGTVLGSGVGGEDASPEPDAAIGDAMTGADAAPSCGNGVIDVAAGEVCDDKNTTSGDGCAADCRSVECTAGVRYEDSLTHHCYWRETATVSRGVAVAACGSIGKGYLFRWANAAERDAVFSQVMGGGGRVWIGLQRATSAWAWDDGTPATDLNFRSGEPSGDGSCVEWGPSNGLNDIPCDVSRDYVCERSPAGSP